MEVSNIFIVCGHTDMRCGIDGLASVVSDKYNLDLFNDAIFLFCGIKKDWYKALYWDRDGFMLLYKRIENGNLQWPKDQDEVKKLTAQELRWLLEGLSFPSNWGYIFFENARWPIQQPKAIKPARKGCIN